MTYTLYHKNFEKWWKGHAITASKQNLEERRKLLCGILKDRIDEVRVILGI